MCSVPWMRCVWLKSPLSFHTLENVILTSGIVSERKATVSHRREADILFRAK